MRVYIKTEEGKSFSIPIPMWVMKLGCGDLSKYLISRNMPENQVKYFNSIDFKQLRVGIDVLKGYRGLKIVEIKSRDGSEVTIIV